jgi:hypothetical protein
MVYHGWTNERFKCKTNKEHDRKTWRDIFNEQLPARTRKTNKDLVEEVVCDSHVANNRKLNVGTKK